MCYILPAISVELSKYQKHVYITPLFQKGGEQSENYKDCICCFATKDISLMNNIKEILVDFESE